MKEKNVKKAFAGGGDACSAMFCSNARWKEMGLAFFSFPKDEARCKQWVQNCRRKDLLGKSAEQLHQCGYHLCSEHFEPNQFNVPTERKRLVWNAIPTLFKVPNPPAKVTPSRPAPKERSSKLFKNCTVSSVDDSSVSFGSQSDSLPGRDGPRASKGESHLKRKLKLERNKVYRRNRAVKRQALGHKMPGDQQSKLSRKQRKEFLIKELYDFLPKSTASFVETQLRVADKHKHGRRWTDSDKVLAITLYHSSHKAYRLLKKVFTLPSVSLLKQTMRNVRVYPGFSNAILNALKLKIQSMPPDAKLCSLVFDEMSIKEKVSYNIARDDVDGFEDFGMCGRTHYVANHATVFMARGLIHPWKQSVGYVLSSGPIDSALLHTLLLECIDKLVEAGLEVKCIVADQGSNNRKMFTQHLKVTEFKPFFIHNSTTVYVLYDPPHLLKCVRNNLKKSGFKVGANIISWKHIVDFYLFDCQSPIRMAPRLTDRHIYMPPFSALSVRLATQVLSHSVAVGLTMISRITNNAEMLQTAHFIEQFDVLFNAFNSKVLTSSQKMGHAVSNSSGHTAFLKECLVWLESVTPTSGISLPCLSGWKMDIRALLALWDDLSTNHGIKFLLTARLNQDCIENFFSRIRGNSASVCSPSAADFRRFLCRAMIDQIFIHSPNSNCEEDSDNFLLHLCNLKPNQHNTAATYITHEPPETVDQIPLDEEVQSLLHILPSDSLCNLGVHKAREGVLTYIAGFIARRLTSCSLCLQCQGLVKGQLTGAEHEMFICLKQLPGCSAGLVVPTKELVELVKQLEGAFCLNFVHVVRMEKVMARLVVALGRVVNTRLVCVQGKCSLINSIIMLFCKIRVHFALKLCTLSFVQKGRKNKKIIKLTHV